MSNLIMFPLERTVNLDQIRSYSAASGISCHLMEWLSSCTNNPPKKWPKDKCDFALRYSQKHSERKLIQHLSCSCTALNRVELKKTTREFLRKTQVNVCFYIVMKLRTAGLSWPLSSAAVLHSTVIEIPPSITSLTYVPKFKTSLFKPTDFLISVYADSQQQQSDVCKIQSLMTNSKNKGAWSMH